MIINNKEISARLRLGLMLFVLIYMVILVLSLVLSWSPKHHLELASTIIFAIGLFFFFSKKLCYIYYNSEGTKIILRYTVLQPLSNGNFSIEMPRRDLDKYELITSNFGLRKSIALSVRTPNGVAKYKPVSISSLTKEEREKLINNLNVIIAE